MNKLLIICGPTATGKTKLGIELAKKFNGEIVSADSRQVYRGMDIGTGKDISGIYNFQFTIFNKFSNDNFQIGFYEMEKIPLWLLDIVEPDYQFNVADYKKCADKVMEDILKRGKLPILVGGTGFYIKAMTEGIGTMGIKPDWKLRDELQRCKVSELQSQLKELDYERWEKMNESDRQNPRRLIRAIEVARWKCGVRSGKKFSLQNPTSHFQLPTSILFIGLTAPFSMLYQRIDQRVDERAEDGIEDEIRGLLDKGYDWDNSALGTTLAYSQWRDYLENKSTKEEVIQRWKFDEHNYARRQMTWFKKNKKISWFGITKDNWHEKVERIVSNWYTINS